MKRIDRWDRFCGLTNCFIFLPSNFISEFQALLVETEKWQRLKLATKALITAETYCTIILGDAIPLSNLTPPIKVAIKFYVTIEENDNLDILLGYKYWVIGNYIMIYIEKRGTCWRWHAIGGLKPTWQKQVLFSCCHHICTLKQKKIIMVIN
jgi:hypothetical protein